MMELLFIFFLLFLSVTFQLCSKLHKTSNLVLLTEFIMQIGRRKELKADISSVSPSSERLEKLWVMCGFTCVIIHLSPYSLQ